MVKAGSEQSKSDLVRKYLVSHGNERNSVLIERIKKETGADVASSMISRIRQDEFSETNGDEQPVARRRKPRVSEFTLTVAELQQAKEFVTAFGSVERAQVALREYEAFVG